MKHVRFVVLAVTKNIDFETEFTYVFAFIVLFSLEYLYRIYLGIISAYILCVSIHEKINIRLRSLRCTSFEVFFHMVNNLRIIRDHRVKGFVSYILQFYSIDSKF